MSERTGVIISGDTLTPEQLAYLVRHLAERFGMEPDDVKRFLLALPADNDFDPLYDYPGGQ